jgi:hypothetical protein
MALYTARDIQIRASKARDESLVVRQSAKNPNAFRVTSATHEGHFYTVKIKIGSDLDSADCTCPAGEKGSQCKHGAASIKARRDQIVSQAAAILRKHQARQRAARAA